MKPLKNPFITSGYESAEYFCDREQESENLIREVINGNNLALISTRRMGKTGLIQHCFNSPEIKDNYYTFFVDIYATKSLRDLVFSLSRVIVDGLKPFGKKAIESFCAPTYNIVATPVLSSRAASGTSWAICSPTPRAPFTKACR